MEKEAKPDLIRDADSSYDRFFNGVFGLDYNAQRLTNIPTGQSDVNIDMKDGRQHIRCGAQVAQNE